MENKKDVLRVTMKDINLLPEEILAASANPQEKRKAQGEANKQVKEGSKGSVEAISSKVPSVQYEKGKEAISSFSKNLKDNLIGSIQQNSDRATSFFQSFKKDKIRNLERLLSVDKKDLSFSNKKNYIYSTGAGRMVIVDRDIWGEPCTVTIKESNQVAIRRVKFFNDDPFLFPIFNEKNLTGDVIHMDEDEIWYLNKSEATLVLFKNDKPDFLKISLDKFKQINNRKMLLNYLDNCKMLYLDKKLNNLLLEERKITIDDIVRIRAGFTIYKSSSRAYKVLLFDEFKVLYDEFTLNKLPSVKEEGWEVLFSKDIVEYVKSNNYTFENFKQDDGYIEYWQNIGSKRACVLRCKI